ncbi:DoxX family protein [Fulvivirga lutimaris]|uniref:DoxX family protein n=1 Tax=Fulvivirga lutimaris TaxID=1819566 RepID=UPI0012BCCC8E|nr:DoxX family protein [Fulvivirga lutimaris]MTI39633.1 DoxX family membrane protein [Fulvivirga lutimaris]
MKRKIIFIVYLLLGLMFINAGLNKLFNYIPVPEDLPKDLQRMNAAFNEIFWLMPLVGIIEVLGGILFIIPKTRPLGAIMLFPILVGIMIVHLTIAPAGLALATIIFAINLWVIYNHREKFLPLINN